MRKVRSPGESRINHAAPDVPDQDVAFLDSGGDRGRDDQGVVNKALGLAAFSSEQADGSHAPFFCGEDGRDDVPAIAAGRKDNQHIPFRAQRLHLATEKTLEAQIIANGGEGEVSVVNAMAGRPRLEVSNLQTNSAAMCWASAALPPLPHMNIRLPPCKVATSTSPTWAISRSWF